MEIREMQRQDEQSINRLLNQLGYPMTVEETARRLTKIKNDKVNGTTIIVAEASNGEILGFAQWLVLDSLLFEPLTYLIALVVDENSRSKGIGSQLLQRVEDWSKDHGMDGVILHSGVERHKAHCFYEKSGYQIRKEQKNILKLF